MGGAPFRGEESIDYLLDLTDVAIDVIAVRTDQAGLLRQKYGAKVSVFGSLDELDCRTYDLIVITPVLRLIAHTLSLTLPFEYANLVRIGGFVVTLGIDAARAKAAHTAALADELALFNKELDLQEAKKDTSVARGLFQYVGNELRIPLGSSYFLWVTLRRTSKPTNGRSDATKWWRLLRPGDSYVLAASAEFLEAFFERFNANPASAFELLPSGESVAPECIHYSLRALFNGRKIAAYHAALLRLEKNGYGDLVFFHRMILDRYEGVFRCDLPQAMLRYQNLAKDNFLKRSFLSVLIDQAARSLDRDMLLTLLHEDSERLRTLPRSVVIGICNALNRLGCPDECRCLMEVYLTGRSGLLRLQFLEIEHHLSVEQGLKSIQNATGFGDWRSVLERVRAERAVGLSNHINEAETAAYSALASIPDGPNDLLDIRFSDARRKRLEQIIERAIVSRQPLALVRLGDGENYAYAEAEKNATVRELTWWGQRPDDKTRAQIKSRVRDAVCNADILGIPSIYRILRHMGDPAGDDGTNDALFSLLSVINAISEKGLLATRVITEERCNQLLFNREFITKLMNLSNRNIWITCWKREQLDIDHTTASVYITIPAHSKTRSVENDECGPLFNVFDRKISDYA